MIFGDQRRSMERLYSPIRDANTARFAPLLLRNTRRIFAFGHP